LSHYSTFLTLTAVEVFQALLYISADQWSSIVIEHS
jgi:hypothetical protein